jgi:hypothetical protein
MRLSETDSLLAGLQYPVTTGEVVDQVGETELELPNGTETLGDAYDRVGGETYDGPREAYTMLLSSVSDRAIGRKAYTDRDPPVHGCRERGPRVVDPLLDDDTRFDADGPHCGVCRHITRVGDWDFVAYCTQKDEQVEPVVDDVCPKFAPLGWSRQGETV